MLTFNATYAIFHNTMSLAGQQINPIYVNFHLQKFRKFDINSAEKTWSKKDKGVESALPHAN